MTRSKLALLKKLDFRFYGRAKTVNDAKAKQAAARNFVRFMMQ
jgi:hypothetical protein